MPNTVIYNGLTDSANLTYTDWFKEASFFYVEKFGGGELELDCYLNIVVEPGVTKVISLLDGEDKNFVDTERVFRIPLEFASPDLSKRLILIPNGAYQLKITIVNGFICNNGNDGNIGQAISELIGLLTILLPKIRILLTVLRFVFDILRNLFPNGLPMPSPGNPTQPELPPGVYPGLPTIL